MVTDGNHIYCGHHFIAYTNIESCCTPKTNVRLYVNSTSIKKMNYRKRLKKKKAWFVLKRKRLVGSSLE